MVETLTVDEARAAGLLPKGGDNKFNARRTPCANGHNHDSEVEAKRCNELHLMERAGEIHSLRIYPSIELQPSFTHNGKRERAITYTADFSYYVPHSPWQVIEEIKGGKATQTEAFKIKRKLLLYRGKDIDLRVIAE